MPELKQGHISPTDEEEAEIQRQIAKDPEDPAHWANTTPLRPVIEVMPDHVERHRPGRGKQKAPTKEKVTVRLDADIVAHFRSTGRGWQTRLNEVLRKSVVGL